MGPVADPAPAAPKQTSAAVSAIMGKAKLHGLLVEKIRSEGPRDLCELTDAQLEAIIRGKLSESGLEELEAIKRDPVGVRNKKPH